MYPKYSRKRAAWYHFVLTLKRAVTLLFFYQLYLLIFAFNQFGFIMLLILGATLALLWWACL